MVKVMLIEDDATMLMLMSTLLEMEGFQVAKLANEQTPEDIIESLHRENPVLAMIDIHIRLMNGLDVVQMIRQDPALQGLRVLMTSGLDQHDECLAAGADNFILKPFMPDDLIKRIRALANK
jgi:DNA-binding response OmpR family regulator